MEKKTVAINDGYVSLSNLDEVKEIASKYDAIHNISRAGYFIAPQVLEVREQLGEIDLEKIESIENLRSSYLKSMNNMSALQKTIGLIRRVGFILANIHNGLSAYQNNKRWEPSALFFRALQSYGWIGQINATDDWPVQTHGDFGFANIFIKPKNAEPPDIVVLDPCSDGYSCLDHWCLGPRELDIGKMLLSLEGKVGLKRKNRISRYVVIHLQKAFIEGYESEMGKKLDKGKCFAFSYALGACYFQSRPGLRKKFGLAILFNDVWQENFPLRKKLEAYHVKK